MHKRIISKLFFLSLVIAAALSCQIVLAAITNAPRQFSADMVYNFVPAKIYADGDKIRRETPDGSIMIFRLDKNVCWFVITSQQIYMEQPIDPSMVPQIVQEFQNETERVSLGREVIGAQKVEKFKVSYMEGPSRLTVYQWLTDSGFPIKTQAEDGSWSVEFSNLSLGPQAPGLFEIPAGYKKIEVPCDSGSGVPSSANLTSGGPGF